MKRFLFPSQILRVETGKFGALNPIVTKPSSFFGYYHSRRSRHHRFFVDNYYHLHGGVRSDSRLQRLLFHRYLSSTRTDIDIAVTTSPENDKSKAIFSAQNSLQQLKNVPAEDAASTFFYYCNVKYRKFDPHLELVVILESLHDNPQTCERFVKTLQELSKNSASANVDGSDGSGKMAYDGDLSFEPMREHYEMILKAWLNFDPPSVKRAQALLDYMEDKADIPYRVESCNLILEAWAKKGNAERTQNFFDIMIRKRTSIDLVSFLHLFRAWSKSKSPLAVNRVEYILSHMESSTSIKPNAECYLRVIECWAKCQKKGSEARIEALIWTLNQRLAKDADHNVNDNVDTIRQEATSNLLKVYHNIGNAHRAEEILVEFANDFQTDVNFPPPTIGMCLSVLSTWSKSKSSRRAHRAEKLLRLMENHAGFPQPDTSCFTAVINCFASSKKLDSAQNAEALLRRMDKKEETKSNLVSMTCVLLAWARSEDLNGYIQAERIFQEMLDRGMQPDRYVYGGLMAAWGRSNGQDAIRKVEDYFQRLKCLEHSKPTVVEYTQVIQAYANYVSKNIDKSRESVERAEALLTEMLNSEDTNLRPNTLSYAAVLKVIAAARRIPDRGERAKKVLQKMETNIFDIPPYIINLVNKSFVCTETSFAGGIKSKP